MVDAESEDSLAASKAAGKASFQANVLPGEPNGVSTGAVIEPDIDKFFDTLGEPKEILEDIQAELERLANRLNRPAIARADGRFPVYVILTIQSALESQYGTQGAAEVLAEMGLLADTIRQQTKHRSSPHLDVFSYWGAKIFCPDQVEQTSQLGIKPARPGDAWDIKLALADLDSVERALNRVGVEYEIDFYKSLLGHEGKGVEPLVQCAEEVYRHLFGEPIKPEAPERASIWTDTNVYNELGIPAIKIGPRGRRIGPRNEEIEIEVMLKAAQIYALMALDICTRERPG